MSGWNVEIKRMEEQRVDGKFVCVPCAPVAVLTVGTYSPQDIRLDADNLHVLIDALNAAWGILKREQREAKPDPCNYLIQAMEKGDA